MTRLLPAACDNTRPKPRPPAVRNTTPATPPRRSPEQDRHDQLGFGRLDRAGQGIGAARVHHASKHRLEPATAIEQALQFMLRHFALHPRERRLLATGGTRGGIPFERGTLFYLLRNRFYIGEVRYKGDILPGEQP